MTSLVENIFYNTTGLPNVIEKLVFNNLDTKISSLHDYLIQKASADFENDMKSIYGHIKHILAINGKIRLIINGPNTNCLKDVMNGINIDFHNKFTMWVTCNCSEKWYNNHDCTMKYEYGNCSCRFEDDCINICDNDSRKLYICPKKTSIFRKWKDIFLYM
jgi:hypothetical protein